MSTRKMVKKHILPQYCEAYTNVAISRGVFNRIEAINQNIRKPMYNVRILLYRLNKLRNTITL